MPVSQLLPPLVEYCQLVPASRPVTLTVPLFVMPSVELTPVSLAKARVGAVGAVVSTVKAWKVVLAMPLLPAASI